jgi:hypothetical protein
MNRRHFLATATMLPLAACAVPTTLSQAATDASTIVTALQAIAPSLLGLLKDPTLATQIQADIATAAQAAAAVATAAPTSTAPLIQQIIQAVQALATIVLPLAGLPPATASIIQAALSLLPGLATAAGLSAATSTVPAMPPEAARLILRAAANG